jgi:hypothetical protein
MRVSKRVLTAVVIAATTVQIFAQNLISNGGFEDAGTGWNLQCQTDFAATVSYPTSGAPEGTTYALINVTQVTVVDPQQDNWKVRLQLPDWEATKNGVYRLTFKARSTTKHLKVGITRGGAGAYIAGYDMPVDTVWQTQSCMFISDTSGTGELRLNFYIGADTGVYEFDSVALEKTGETTPTDNLIANGGFELDGAGWGTYLQQDVGASATFTYPTAGAPEGSRYADITVISGGDASQVQLQTPLFTAELDATYIITFKAKGTANIFVVSQGDQTTNFQVKESKTQYLTTDWATYSAEFVADAAGYGAFRLNFHCGGNDGTYDFDSVYVTKSEMAALRNSSGKLSQEKKLTIRKVGGGMLVALPNSRTNGNYSLAMYSPSGRLLGSHTGFCNGSGEVLLPLKSSRGMVLVVYSDQGSTVRKNCFVY